MTRHAGLRGRGRATANAVAFGALTIPGPAFAGALPWLALAVAVTAVLLFRAATIRVDEDDEGLVVRNVFTTRRVRWADVVSFHERRAFLVSARWRDTVVPVVVTRRGSVPLLAMPVAQRLYGAPERRYDDSVVVERWAARAT